MRIHDVMSRHVLVVFPDDTAAIARERLRGERMHHLVVLDGKRVAGVLSERDLASKPDEELVHTLMTTPVVTIDPDATLRRAAAVLESHAIGCLPVVKDDRLEGIVTTTDLLRALANGKTHAPTVRGARPILRKRGPRKHGVAIY